ncbi:40S ribosomal protein S27 [Diplonema papillatum]|nr:40S ribosomal protein S27 [Diplonema papillatum]|eukprot:gene9101-14099_t
MGFLDADLLYPSLKDQKNAHKKKRLLQGPKSCFLDVRCQSCSKVTVVFSHASTVVMCAACSAVLAQPAGGKARLTAGSSFRVKSDI